MLSKTYKEKRDIFVSPAVLSPSIRRVPPGDNYSHEGLIQKTLLLLLKALNTVH